MSIKTLVLFGCFAVAVSCQPEENAKLVIRLTDSPGDYEAVNIDLQGIEVHGEGGWTQLPNVHTGIYNLLDLTDGKETVLVSSDYPAGKITQIRLILGDNNSILMNGQDFPLETPSAQQSGLKLLLNAELTAGITYSVLLDFDAAKSIVETGSGRRNLKPVVKVISDALDGAISGEVTPEELTVAVFAIDGLDTLGTSYVKEGATNFFIGGLPAGSYTLSFDPGEMSGYLAATKEDVIVALGKITTAGNTTLELE